MIQSLRRHDSNILMKLSLFFLCLFFLPAPAGFGSESIIKEIQIRGNGKVEADAILTILKSKVESPWSQETMRHDIRGLFDLGYFSDIRIYRREVPGGITLIVEVVEKPAITAISFEGLEEVSEDDFSEKMQTKLYTIVNEETISRDTQMIERHYAEKGFYLARVTYVLEKKGTSEVSLKFIIEESGKVLVAEVDIMGNKTYTDTDLIKFMGSKPYTRGSAISSSSIYQDEFVRQDLERIQYWYKDWGFKDIKVAKPIVALDSDRNFVRIGIQLEEGQQFSVGKISVSGDVLFDELELLEEMELKPGELFRYSRFRKDLEMLIDKYGDLGYAYVDVNPITTDDPQKLTVDINYDITKGSKVYFGEMLIIGNTKTRDNVIRRDFAVADSELYSGTRLSESRDNINRLGFFEEVQVLRERDPDQENVLNLKFKVKEKATGQLQASLAASPESGKSFNIFGQGSYDEKNQSGRGWGLNLTGKWDGGENYSLSTQFVNPRVNDSQWSLALSLSYRQQETLFSGLEFTEIREGAGITVGRKIIELIRGSIGYSITRSYQKEGDFIFDRFRPDGIKSEMTLGLSRRDLDNYIDPTDGSSLSLEHGFVGGPILGGDFQFMESTLDTRYYFPVDFTDTFRTHFRLQGVLGHLWSYGGKEIPFTERYRLGGDFDLRGYGPQEISPRFSILRSPTDSADTYPKGGDKQIYFQLEYFVPLIPEAGIKGLVFADAGRVFDMGESLSMQGFAKDVGFGIRWLTPLAPFRIEWAFPINEDGSLGRMRPIFSIGFER